MSEEIKQDWRKELEHVVKYRLTTDFVTDRQILTELFDHLLLQALQQRDMAWKIEILSLGTPTYYENESKEHFNGRREATDQIRQHLLSTLNNMKTLSQLIKEAEERFEKEFPRRLLESENYDDETENIKDFLKKSKLLSKTADTITKGLAEGSTARSIVGKVGAFAKEQGYGKRKRRTRKM